MKIAITGGHLTPAISVIEALRNYDSGVKILYFGRKFTFEGKNTVATEYEVIPRLGATYIVLNTGRLQRAITKHTLISLCKIPVGFIQAFSSLMKQKPDGVISFGGYLAVPVVISAWILKIPVLIHEQTVTVGLATKITSKLASCICVSWPQTLSYFPSAKTVVTGNPIRKEIFIPFNKKYRTTVLGSYLDNIPVGEKVLYITGGNQGSQLINRSVIDVLPSLLEKYYVIHQTGSLDEEYVRSAVDGINPEFMKKYYTSAWFNSQECGWIVNSADLVISRSGANTICELLALHKRALLIPIPWTSQNEQQKNAQLMVEAGLARILPQYDLTGKNLLAAIERVLTSDYKEKISAEDFIIKDAAQKIVAHAVDCFTDKRKLLHQ